MSKSLITGFLDTNVLVNWILLDVAITRKRGTREKLLQALSKEASSYLLLEKVRSNESLRGTLKTSRLAFAELLSALLNEHLISRMHNQGIPFRFMERERYKARLTQDERDEMASQIRHLETEFFSPPDVGRIDYLKDTYEFDDVLNLMTEHKIDQYDAILLSTAYRKNCAHFITQDDTLRRSLKVFGTMNITSPQNFLTNVMRHETGIQSARE